MILSVAGDATDCRVVWDHAASPWAAGAVPRKGLFCCILEAAILSDGAASAELA